MSARVFVAKSVPLSSLGAMGTSVKAEEGSLALTIEWQTKPMRNGRGAHPCRLVRITGVTGGGEVSRYVRLETDQEPETEIRYSYFFPDYLVDASAYDPDEVIRLYRQFLDDRIEQAIGRAVTGDELDHRRRRIRPWDSFTDARALLAPALLLPAAPAEAAS
ncbi:hypothetical protein ACG83_10100 [Frankia sp. R43]|uniref:hypothetical protein n=1 Tax=Frankia sp. R43 TaxID=269536 RepID=UPI0006CA01A9|nr:hypothetical protein [Frankia sp. R43]KPM55635.1 hypothetical protein ACG83_10100 [Frankia sp. R43]